MNIIHTCRPKTGSITVSKVVTDFAEDATYFHVTLTGSSAEPTVVSGYVQQGTPITFTDLPFDTYTLAEDSEDGYLLNSITPNTVTLSRSNRSESIVVTNELIVIETIKYGAIYNVPAITDARGMFSVGWDCLSKTEYETIQTALGGDAISGGKLKESGLVYFNTPNTGADNSSGFNGRGNGQRDGTLGTFNALNTNCFLWTKTYVGYGNNYYQFQLSYNSAASVSNSFKPGDNGLGVRVRKSTTTLTDGQTGVYTDPSGYHYRTICIGGIEVTSDCIKTKHYRNGDPIQVITDNAAWAALTTGAMCYYNNDITNA